MGLIDLMPTLCSYVGLDCPAASGVSLLSANSSAAGAPRYLAAEGVPGLERHRTIRGRRYKLLFEPAGPLGENLVRDHARGREHPYSLYDLRADSGERIDLLADEPVPSEAAEIFETLRPALHAAIPAGPAAQPRRAPIDPELRRRLEALGYAGKGSR